ncbi:MAG: ECF transporter S component [Clostridia bacterium]|nr:ECF transporter S component [Clostridia bacterium]
MKNLFNFTAKQIAGIAVLLALVIVLQAVGGSITIGAVSLNFTLIPIVLGGILFGATVGGILGFACGVVVLIQVIMGLNPFYLAIWSNDPVVTTLTCILKTTVAGILCGVVYKLISKKSPVVALFTASAIVPVVNTGLFIVGCLFMSSVYGMSEGQNVLVFILVGLVTFNFFFEFLVNVIVAPALKRVIKIVNKE